MVSEQRDKRPSSPLNILRSNHRPPRHPAPTQPGRACPDPTAMGILPPALWLPAVMQVGSSSSATASPTPPLLICVCLPTAWKRQEGSSNFCKCRTTTTNSPEVRTSAFTTPMSLSCTAPQQVPLLTSTCSLQLLPLSILTVRINLQKKRHRKPPRSCRSHAWPLTTQRKRDRCPTVSCAGSPNSPGSNWSNSAQCWKQDHAPCTSLATGKPGQPLWLHPAPKMGHSCKCCLHIGAITGQQLCPTSGTPAIPKGARAAGIGQITVPMKLGTNTSNSQTSGLPVNLG